MLTYFYYIIHNYLSKLSIFSYNRLKKLTWILIYRYGDILDLFILCIYYTSIKKLTKHIKNVI